MKRGDTVMVRVYPDGVVARVAWEVLDTWVMVCRPQVFQEAIANGEDEPRSWMGFPLEDVSVAMERA